MDTVNKVMELSPNIALVILVGIGIIIILLIKNAKKIKAFGDGFYNTKKKNEEYKKMLINADKKVGEHENTIKEQDSIIQKLKGEVSNLQEKIEEYEKANEEHWDVSVEYRNKYDEQQCRTVESFDRLTDAINALGEKIDQNQKKTDERFKESEEKNQKRIRAELKDKIMRAYRLHHQTKRITQMELESLEGLVEEYFAVNGNSFVEKYVQPEMYTWSVEEEFD